MKRIRDLDFDAIMRAVASRVDPVHRRGCDRLLDIALAEASTPELAVMGLRNHVLVAALEHTKTLDHLTIDRPLVEALVRLQHHPLARPVPNMKVQEALRGPNAAPRLTELIDAHPELGWDLDAVQSLILREIREVHGDHELDDSEPPWLMHWSPASAAFSALMLLVTLRTLGEI